MRDRERERERARVSEGERASKRERERREAARSAAERGGGLGLPPRLEKAWIATRIGCWTTGARVA